jgi:hypothetical protein
MSDEPQGLELGEVSGSPPARPTSSCPSRTSTCPSVPATASSGPRSTPSASCSRRARTTCSPSPTSGRSRSMRSSRSSTSAACRSVAGTEPPCLQLHARAVASAAPPHQTPDDGQPGRLAHRRPRASSPPRPRPRRCARRREDDHQGQEGRACTTSARSWPSSGDKDMASKLFEEIGPRYAERRVATPASSSSARATATTRRWRASNWSEPGPGPTSRRGPDGADR